MIRISEHQLSPAHLTSKPPEHFKVLVVDDDARIVDALSSILRQDKYRVYQAADAEQAWDVINQEHPDLSITDVLMPGIDGIELCRRIKQSPETRLSMVILMTGIAERSRRLEGLTVGADDFLRKPIDPFELTVRVRTLLRTKELYDEIETNRKDLETRVAERTQELQEANTRLQELNLVKSNILGMVSHELRTPLLKVKSGLWLAMQDGVDKEQRAQIRTTMEEALSMLEYRITDVGLFSDPPDLTIAQVVVGDLVSSAVEQVKILQPGTQDRIHIEPLKDLPPVLVDSTAVSRVLAHIIDNGLKFSDGKPVIVRAVGASKEVTVSVQDQGIGMPEKSQERLFLPLEQGDYSATRRHGGLGMGLALVKAILDAHRIQFSITTKEGAGTTVTLILPTKQH